MNKKQYSLVLLSGVVAGFVGGGVMSWSFRNPPVFAEKKVKPATSIEAQEFRLVDKDGRTGARLTMQDGKVFAEVPDLTEWRIKLLEVPK